MTSLSMVRNARRGICGKLERKSWNAENDRNETTINVIKIICWLTYEKNRPRSIHRTSSKAEAGLHYCENELRGYVGIRTHYVVVRGTVAWPRRRKRRRQCNGPGGLWLGWSLCGSAGLLLSTADPPYYNTGCGM